MLTHTRNFLRYIPRPEARAIFTSLAVGVSMLLVKLVAYAYTQSAAILSDALEQVVNVVASGFAIYALSTAHRPADEEHPYGHGKIEFLSAGFEGGMIVLAAIIMIGSAARRMHHILGHDKRLESIGVGLALMAVAMSVHGILGLYLLKLSRRDNSITLEAEGWHLLTDALTSAVAAVALLIVRSTGWNLADPIGAIIIAIYISVVGYKMVRRAAAGLMDEQDRSDGKMLRELLDAHVNAKTTGREPRICSYHKLRHRHSGRYHWVDFHIMLPARWDIQRAHQVASTVEYEIEQALSLGNATAHIEPCDNPDCEACLASQHGK